MTDRIKRFEQAANMLVAGKKVSVAVKELPQGNVQAWLAELKSYVIFGHTDPGDEVTYRVYVTVKEGKAIAAAKLVYVDWRLYFPLGNQGLLQPSIPTFPTWLPYNPCQLPRYLHLLIRSRIAHEVG